MKRLGPFHDPVASAAREHLAAMLRDDGGNAVGVSLVFDRVVDLRAGDPVGGHDGLQQSRLGLLHCFLEGNAASHLE